MSHTEKAKWVNDYRDNINYRLSIVSAIIALSSLMYAIFAGSEALPVVKFAIVGFWVIVPPVYFWCDWHFLCRDIPQNKVDSVKHIHDLSRNIWVALVVILIALFDIDLRP